MVDHKCHPSCHYSMKYANFWDISNSVCAPAEFVQKTDFQDSLKIISLPKRVKKYSEG